ncbi:hypothetical protein BRC92_00400 [Halobacteriales archaeon QS_4_69_31]|nr:MAG: hypothetical protein BRC92_00400 [Halobacteriales archaeon QS_4_69_31]
MPEKSPELWNVEEGDKFTRSRGMPDVWEVVEIVEEEGFGTERREVTLRATEYKGDGGVDIEVNNHTSQFSREFEAVDE